MNNPAPEDQAINEIKKTINKVNYILYPATKTAIVIQSPEATGQVIINNFIEHESEKYFVIEIGDKAFRNSNIQSLKFEPGSQVRRFGRLLFQNSTISELYIPDSLENYSSDWCNGTDFLTEIIINNNPHLKYEDGFLINKEEKEIIFARRDLPDHQIIPSDIKRIGHSSFHLCKQVTSILIESTEIEHIDTFAFCQCDKLINFKLISPGKRIIIGENCFTHSPSLANFTITCEELVLSNNCLHCCTSLSTLNFTIPRISIGYMCMFGCDKLCTFSLPENKSIEIEEKSFLNLQKLKSIVLKTEQLSIKDNSFENCESISNVYFRTDNELNSDIFKNFKLMQEINLTSASELTITKSSLEGTELLRTIRFRSNKLELEEGCLKKHPNLLSITIECQNSIEFKSDDFEECNNLKTFKFIKSPLFDASEKIELPENSFLNSENLDEVEIAASIVSLGKSCFSGSKKLHKVQLHGKEITISDNCFENCNSIRTFSITKSNDIGITEKIELSENSFINSENLEEVEIEANVINLGKSCFSGSKNLQKVILHGKEITISDNCFENCNSIKVFSITKPNDIEPTEKIELSENSFINSENLEEVEIAANVINLGKSCFAGSKKLQKVNLHGKEITISDNCFENCNSVNALKKSEKPEEIEITADIINLGKSSFSGSKKLQKVQLQGKKITISDNCFEKCDVLNKFTISKLSDTEPTEKIELSENSFINSENLKEIEIAASTINLGKSCFSGSKKLQKVQLRGKEITISDNCFENCNCLNEFTISRLSDTEPTEKIELSENSFINSENLKEIEITADTINLGKSCFSGSKNLQKVQLHGKKIKISDNCFENCNSIRTFSITKSNDIGVTEKIELPTNSFTNSENLEEVKIEANVINLGKSCFSGTKNIQKVNLHGKEITISDNCFKKIYSSINIFKKSEKPEEIEITADTINLGKSSFSGSKNLQKVNLHGKEIKISDNCFENCYSLKTFTITKSEGIDRIEKIELSANSFLKATKLNEVELKAHKIIIGENSFKGASSVKKVSLEAGNVAVHDQCFNDCTELSSFTISKAHSLSIGSKQFINCGKLKTISIAVTQRNSPIPGVEKYEINDDSFKGADNLNKIEITGGSVTFSNELMKCPKLTELTIKSAEDIEIMSKMFNKCENLTKVELEATILTINENCFNNNKKLKTIKLNCFEVTIRDHCFNNNSKCNSLIFTNSDQIYIESNSFCEMNSLKQIKIESYSNLTISQSCFTESESLQTASFFSKEVVIGSGSFSECTSLNTVSINKTVTSSLFRPSNIAITFSPNVSRKPIESIFIGDNSFKLCNNLAKLSIEAEKEISIGDYSFSNLANLGTIEMNNPPSLSIGEDCFLNCPGKKSDPPIAEPENPAELGNLDVKANSEKRQSFHSGSMNKNFENKRKYDSFYVLGIDRYNREPSFISMFPSLPVSFTDNDISLIKHHCYPQGRIQIPRALPSDTNVVNGFVFFQNMHMKEEEGREKLYIGVCLYIRIPLSANSFVGSQYDRTCPFCLCLITDNPNISSHFTFLHEIADLIANYRDPGREIHGSNNNNNNNNNDDNDDDDGHNQIEDEIVIPKNLENQSGQIIRFLTKDQRCKYTAKSSSSKSMSFLLPKLVEYYKSTSVLIYEQFNYFLFPTLQTLLSFISPSDIVELFFCSLSELQVVFISQDTNKSSFCSVALAYLSRELFVRIFPHLPTALSNIFNSPYKPIIGYHDRNGEYEVLVDLDNGEIVYNVYVIETIRGFPYTSVLARRISDLFESNKSKFTIPPSSEEEEFANFIKEADRSIYPECFKYFAKTKYILTQDFVKEFTNLLNEPFISSLREFIKAFLVFDTTDPDNPVTFLNHKMFKHYIQGIYKEFMYHFITTTTFDQLELSVEEEVGSNNNQNRRRGAANFNNQNQSQISLIASRSKSRRRSKSSSKTSKGSRF